MYHGANHVSGISKVTFGGKAARNAFSTASTSMISWAIAPSTGPRKPAAAKIIRRDTQRHSADRALERDDPHPAADVHEFVHLLQRVIHDHDAGGFRGHVAVLSDRHADGGGHHGRRVVDAIADVERLARGRFLARTMASFSSGLCSA